MSTALNFANGRETKLYQFSKYIFNTNYILALYLLNILRDLMSILANSEDCSRLYWMVSISLREIANEIENISKNIKYI